MFHLVKRHVIIFTLNIHYCLHVTRQKINHTLFVCEQKLILCHLIIINISGQFLHHVKKHVNTRVPSMGKRY